MVFFLLKQFVATVAVDLMPDNGAVDEQPRRCVVQTTSRIKSNKTTWTVASRSYPASCSFPTFQSTCRVTN